MANITRIGNLIETIQGKNIARAGVRLFRYIQETQHNEIPPLGKDDYFRASRMEYLCPREEVLAQRYEIIRIDAHETEPSLHITLRIGDSYHDTYRHVFYGPMGEWQGAWKCIRCDWNTDEAGLSAQPERHKKFPGKISPMPMECPSCGAKAFDDRGRTTHLIQFMEWLLLDDELYLEGHPDGWCVKPRMKRIVADLKSQSKDQFTRRRSLQPGHDVQITAYMHMSMDEKGELWYLNKSPWGEPLNFVKDLKVDFDRDFFNKRVRRPLLEMREGLNGGAIPKRTICDRSDCSRAKLCQLAELCFAL
jgi:hypothetical protein